MEIKGFGLDTKEKIEDALLEFQEYDEIDESESILVNLSDDIFDES